MISLSTTTLLTVSTGSILRPFPSFSANEKFESWFCYGKFDSGVLLGAVDGPTIVAPGGETLTISSHRYLNSKDQVCLDGVLLRIVSHFKNRQHLKSFLLKNINILLECVYQYLIILTLYLFIIYFLD